MAFVLPQISAAGGNGSPVVRTLEIQGNAFYAAGEIRSWMITRTNQPYDSALINADLRTIVSTYREGGFLNVQASTERCAFNADSSTVDITIAVREGRRTLIESFIIEGARSMTEGEIVERFESRPANPLNVALLEQDVADLLHRYEKLGYPFARCGITQVRSVEGTDVDSLTVTLTIDEGELVRIETVRVEGNRETDAEVIIREARIQPGEVFDPEKMSAVRQRLQRMNIFSSVEEPELYLSQGKGGLLLKVQEGNANTFDGVAGYVPSSTEGGSGYLMGLVSVSMRNLFGTGRKLHVRWEKEDRFTQDLNLGYSEPWLFGFPFTLGGEFNQRKQDTTYVRQGLRLQGDVLASEVLAVGLVFTTESVIPSSDVTAALTPRSSTVSIGSEILYDTRDDPYSPLSGARYRVDYHYGRKTLTGLVPTAAEQATQFSVQRLGLDLDSYLQLIPRQVLAIGLHARQIESGRLDASDLYRFGGANSMRGYRESQFSGSRVAWTNLEYRFVVGRRSFFFGFFDTGYYYLPGESEGRTTTTEAFKYGYGVGLRFDTALGNLGVSFALGKGDSFSQGKVHIGIINEF